MTLLRNLFLGLIIAVLTLLVLLAVTHPGQVAIRTVALLPEVVPGSPVRPLAQFSDAPTVEEVSYPYLGGQASGTLFRPADAGPHGAVVLFLGINPALQDETLLSVARGLARAGVVVLIHQATLLDQGVASYEEVEGLVGAFQFLRRSKYVDPLKIGLAGFCVGSSLSLIAAADPRISNQVLFVNFFGGYYSARDFLAAATTRQQRFGDINEPWEPNPEAYSWAAQQLTRHIADAGERQQVEQALFSGPLLDTDAAERLSPRAQAIYLVLANRNPGPAERLYSALPLDIQEELELLSPNNRLDGLRTKVYIMHDRNDSYVPFVESRRLDAALRAMSYPQIHFTEFALFQHMHPSRSLDARTMLAEVVKLFHHLYLLMLDVS